jgi:cobalt-zinc-cadmium efflux system membrane fusion protein
MNIIKGYGTAILVALFCACGSPKVDPINKNKEDSQVVSCSADQRAAIGILIDSAVMKERSGTINVNGIIDVPPGNKSFISLPFGGYIKRMNVLEGKRISKGEVLFEVQHPDVLLLQQEYLELNGKLEYLEGEYTRQLKMETGNATSQKNIQAARSELNVARAKFKGIAARLKLAQVDMKSLNEGNISEVQQIRAPFSGAVTKITTGVGSFVSPNDKLLEIIDLTHAHAELTVFEKDIPSLKVGQFVDIHFMNSPKGIAAEVYLIGGEIGPDRSVKVHCHFKSEQENVLPGSYFQAKIHTSARKTLTLPASAFITIGNDHFVFQENSRNQFKLIQVKVLGEENGEVAFELKNGWVKKDFFVVKGAFELLSLLNKSEE